MVRGSVHCRVLVPFIFFGSSCGPTIRKVTGGVGRPVHDHECSLIHNQLQEFISKQNQGIFSMAFWTI